VLLNPYLRRKEARLRQRGPRRDRFWRAGVSEDGYVLIVLMLFFALLAISLTAAAPAMMQRIRREREIELMHRGKQYAHAIRLFYRKFGRYPVRLEELEATNRTRFLRRRYKDPMTPSGEWRLIHFGEAQLTLPNSGPVLPGATTPGATTGATAGVAGPGASSAFASTFSLGSQPGPGQGSAAAAGQSGATAFQTGATPSGSTESSQSGQSSGQPGQPGQPGTPASQLSSPLGGGPTFGGGPIVGVASTSKKQSIKELNQKNHYNDWEFVYDPRLELGAVQALPGVANQPNQIAPGMQGMQGSPGLQPGLTSPGMPGMTGMQPTNPTR